MACSTLLLATPMAWALMIFGTEPPDPSPGVQARLVRIENLGPPVEVAEPNFRIEATGDRSRAALGAETASAVVPAPRGPRAPVVLPGYLLPVDGTEESAHAGG